MVEFPCGSPSMKNKKNYIFYMSAARPTKVMSFTLVCNKIATCLKIHLKLNYYQREDENVLIRGIFKVE